MKTRQIEIPETLSDEDIHVYVPWPDSQDYMDEPWFDDEAILDVENGPNYFIPLSRYVEHTQEETA